MKAWELLTDPAHWTTQAYARNKYEHNRFPTDDDAVCWCAVGAIRKCYPTVEGNEKLHLLMQDIGSISGWNDSSDHATVLAKLKELDI